MSMISYDGYLEDDRTIPFSGDDATRLSDEDISTDDARSLAERLSAESPLLGLHAAYVTAKEGWLRETPLAQGEPKGGADMVVTVSFFLETGSPLHRDVSSTLGLHLEEKRLASEVAAAQAALTAAEELTEKARARAAAATQAQEALGARAGGAS